ncbi:uncharacterized protein LOC100182471 [Ciona intestinalis]
MNANENTSVPIVYVGNDDVGKHIKGVGPKKKPVAKGIALVEANQLAPTFGKVGKENQENVKTPAPKSTRKKKVKLHDPTKPVDPEPQAQPVCKDSMNLYSFKTPKKSKQMNKFAEESARKSRAGKLGGNTTETKKKQTPRKKGEGKFSLRLRQEENESSSGNDCSEDESNTDHSEEEEDTAQLKVPSEPTDERRQSTTNRTSPRLKLPSERELYFDAHGGKKGKAKVTSDHTLQKLKNPRMDPDQLNTALQKHSSKDEASDVDVAKAKLFDGYKSCFREWMFYLCSNFNLLLFGLGSKRQIIHSFCDSMLKNQHKLILNGFFPGLTIKSILTSICEDILDETTAAHSQDEMLNTITKHYNSDDEKSDHLFLIIHNIDGAPLRTSNSQGALCKLADIKRIHIIASIDHINAPLAWDQSKLTRFRWLWHDVTTYASYTAETSYEGSLLLSSAGAGLGARGAALALSGLLHVAKSLTSNARGVFKILIEHQLEEKEEEENQEAFSFTDLYRICRERFLVNSELTLKAHLTEFVDHKLVNIHKGSDGGEYLSVPLDPTTLKEYLEYDFNQ